AVFRSRSFEAELCFQFGDQLKINISRIFLVQDVELFFDQTNAAETKNAFVAMFAHDHIGAGGKIAGVYAVAGMVAVLATGAMRAIRTACAMTAVGAGK